MSEVLDRPGIYLVGSYYAPTVHHGLDEIASVAGEYLVAGMPDGELDTPAHQRTDWVIGNMIRLENTPGIITVRRGGYQHYGDMSVLDIGPDGINPDDLDLGYYEAAKETLPYVGAALEAYDLAHLPQQIGIPGYTQIPAFAFDPSKSGLPAYYEPFQQALQDETLRILRDPALQEQGVVIQTEHPVETIAAIQASASDPEAGRAVAHRMGRGIAAQISHVPPDTTTAVHFCAGRFRGVPAVALNPQEPGAYEPIVNVINAALQHWPADHEAPRVISFPVLPEGSSIELGDRAIFEIAAQIGDIALPKGTILAPGIVTYKTTVDQSFRLASAIQARTDEPIAVAAPCGLGSLRPGNQHNYPPDAALTVLRQHVDVAARLRATWQ